MLNLRELRTLRNRLSDNGHELRPELFSFPEHTSAIAQNIDHMFQYHKPLSNRISVSIYELDKVSSEGFAIF